jgi:hypothetical protein
MAFPEGKMMINHEKPGTINIINCGVAYFQIKPYSLYIFWILTKAQHGLSNRRFGGL